jgi:hypothetical protein
MTEEEARFYTVYDQEASIAGFIIETPKGVLALALEPEAEERMLAALREAGLEGRTVNLFVVRAYDLCTLNPTPEES